MLFSVNESMRSVIGRAEKQHEAKRRSVSRATDRAGRGAVLAVAICTRSSIDGVRCRDQAEAIVRWAAPKVGTSARRERSRSGREEEGKKIKGR